MDNSEYVVCFGAENVLNLINRCRRGTLRSRSRGIRGKGYVSGRGAWHGNNGGGFNFRGNARYNRNGIWRCRGHTYSLNNVRGSTNNSIVVQKSRFQLPALKSSAAIVEQDDFNDMKCPVIRNVSLIGDSFALRLAKKCDFTVKGKYKLCEGGLTMNGMKQRLSECDGSIFTTESVVMLMGMNDVSKVNVNDYDGEMFSLFSKLKSIAPGVVFYICCLPLLPDDAGQRILHFNKIVDTLTSLDATLIKIDLQSIFYINGELDTTFYEKMYKSDLLDIHPNAKGLEVICNIIFKHFGNFG